MQLILWHTKINHNGAQQIFIYLFFLFPNYDKCVNYDWDIDIFK
jgi:hypothetical protein